MSKESRIFDIHYLFCNFRYRSGPWRERVKEEARKVTTDVQSFGEYIL